MHQSTIISFLYKLRQEIHVISNMNYEGKKFFLVANSVVHTYELALLADTFEFDLITKNTANILELAICLLKL